MAWLAAHSGVALLRRDFGTGEAWIRSNADRACALKPWLGDRHRDVLEGQLRGAPHTTIARERGWTRERIDRYSSETRRALEIHSTTDVLRCASGTTWCPRPCVVVAGSGGGGPIVRQLERLGCPAIRASTASHACDVSLAMPTMPLVVVLPALAHRSHGLVAQLVPHAGRVVIALPKRGFHADSDAGILYVSVEDLDTIERLVLLEAASSAPRPAEADAPAWLSDWPCARAIYVDTLAHAGDLDERRRETATAWLESGCVKRAAKRLSCADDSVDTRSRRLREPLGITCLDHLVWRIAIAVDGWSTADIVDGHVEVGKLPQKAKYPP